jgi:hypothetical protein
MKTASARRGADRDSATARADYRQFAACEARIFSISNRPFVLALRAQEEQTASFARILATVAEKR